MRLTQDELTATEAKIAKLNARAAKRGWNGRIDIASELVTETETNIAGFEVTREFFETTVTGEPPKYDGWTFLASLDFDPDSGLVVRAAPGVPPVDRSQLREGACDHCKIDRDRRHVYLVQHDDGRTVQVGSTCLKDFLGWNTSPVFVSAQDVSDEIESGFGGGQAAHFTTDTVLAATWASVKVTGYRPASFENATKYLVLNLLDPRTPAQREYAQTCRPYFDQAYPQAKVIRDYILSDAFGGDSDYVVNLKGILSGDFISPKNLGFAVSAVSAWAKSVERDLFKKAEAAKVNNEVVGQVKDKLVLKVQVQAIRYIDGAYGTTTLYTLVDEAGHVFKWFSSSGPLGDETGDTWYDIKGTVKSHDDYEGKKSTILTRCKVL